MLIRQQWPIAALVEKHCARLHTSSQRRDLLRRLPGSENGGHCTAAAPAMRPELLHGPWLAPSSPVSPGRDQIPALAGVLAGFFPSA